MKNKLVRYYGVSLGLIVLIFVIVGCEVVPSKPFEYPLQCRPIEIKYCEGHGPAAMKCRCINVELETLSDFRMA